MNGLKNTNMMQRKIYGAQALKSFSALSNYDGEEVNFDKTHMEKR